MSKITVKLYDRVTQFNDVDVETINQVWGDTDYVLVYKDGEFTGTAQPLGNKTLEYWQEYFQKIDDEQEAMMQSQQSQLDTIEANTSYLVMMSE